MRTHAHQLWSNRKRKSHDGDCPLGDGTFYDPYSFSGTAGQQVAVSMTSSEFDTFLILNRPDGSTLTFDDGGGGTNSRIPPSGFITLPVTGTYTIWANAFDPADTTGAFADFARRRRARLPLHRLTRTAESL